MTFNTEQLLLTLPIMLKGMGGIFIVTLAIIAIITLLNRLSGHGEKRLRK